MGTILSPDVRCVSTRAFALLPLSGRTCDYPGKVESPRCDIQPRSAPICDNQRQSAAISGNQRQSAAISGNQSHQADEPSIDVHFTGMMGYAGACLGAAVLLCTQPGSAVLRYAIRPWAPSSPATRWTALWGLVGVRSMCRLSAGGPHAHVHASAIF